MARKRYTPEEIIQHLRTVELEQGKGLKLDAIFTEKVSDHSLDPFAFKSHKV